MIRKDIRALSAYHVPDSSGMIKLDAMENPFVLSDDLQEAWLDTLKQVEINRYPDADMYDLRERIAQCEGLDANQVLLGNGSDEIIQMLLLANEPGTCVTPAPTFVMYNLMSQWVKRSVATVPLNKDFSLDANTFLQVCAREKAVIAFLACPNNPTGNLWSRETIEKIIREFRGLVVIDEAYAPFSEGTYTDLIAPSVLVLRTFSKMGWAGLRLGYVLGDAGVITDLNKIRMPYNINSLTQISARFFLQHNDVFAQQARDICHERSRMMASLMAMDDVDVFPSQANFILLRVKNADAICVGLKEKNILIKNMHAQGGLLSECLRVTIGLPDENNAFLTALREVLL
ncbi:MAG: histidinol-phosphate transaminase [Mariprofundaceae bacterium]|nr:histidinol-phosphate transaminase [Mariprofundaceae bacterium]